MSTCALVLAAESYYGSGLCRPDCKHRFWCGTRWSMSGKYSHGRGERFLANRYFSELAVILVHMMSALFSQGLELCIVQTHCQLYRITAVMSLNYGEHSSGREIPDDTFSKHDRIFVAISTHPEQSRLENMSRPVADPSDHEMQVVQ